MPLGSFGYCKQPRFRYIITFETDEINVVLNFKYKKGKKGYVKELFKSKGKSYHKQKKATITDSF
ncbi:hypothetical protein BAX94_03545 [Elizabethkingia meningoseptica]|uniref:Uncharacterized protein n=1 Tax=Elizabethkingia meningoseptica TaxID=238 RepID=A0A1V3U1B1_ELIME|nr:hypothetical protein BBD35_18055 [Elizabethkingia meningoseptica]ODM51277.1 hypothetical protein BES09_16935 [Elizabethkingia meningoseptica]OHT26892.1 hypothetical protein BFF93_15210 [Elizabethkingia meningoseptica]OHT31656.1 hypothetical protein BGC12_05000 [Elizabethkingia meningoseptica]OOH95252.1 hypothetical protein BMF97_10455 [Elizabethkingia meningoseptica]